MKRTKKIIPLLLLPALVLAGFTSCIKEDLSGCPPIDGDHSVKVVVELPREDTKGYYDFHVESVDLYIFSAADGKYVGGYGQRYNDAGTTFVLTLPAGGYRLVAWTNHGSSYELNHSRGESLSRGITYRDMVLSLAMNPEETVREDMPDLHFGHLTDVVVEKGKNNEFTVRTIPYTNIINLTVQGLPLRAAGYTMDVTDDNSQYTFDNNYSAGGAPSARRILYSRPLLPDGAAKAAASMKTLRLTDPDIYPEKTNPVLSITDNSARDAVYTTDLTELIKRAYRQASLELDFDRETVFDIILRFDAGMEATVSVNGWNLSEQPGELE